MRRTRTRRGVSRTSVFTTHRRTVLRTAGGVVGGTSVLSSSTVAEAGESASTATIHRSKTRSLGNGDLSSFVTTTADGKPTSVGVHLSAGALEGLPTADDVAANDRSVDHQGLWSLPFRLPLPEAAPPPFDHVGFGWNPEGHPPRGVWNVPHFDFHFHFESPDTVSTIDKGVIDELPDRIVPEGYMLAEDGAVIPKMGAHLAPAETPEFNDGEFSNTLIWGAADVDDSAGPELHFVEPMVTVDHLRGLSGVDRRPVAQPDSYPTAGWYPTAYTVGSLDSGGYVVVLAAFEERT